MEGLNEVTLVGNLGKDPERVKVNWPLLKFSIAVTEPRPIANGKWRDDTQWFRIVLKGNRVAYFEKKLRKGDTVLVSGRLCVRTYKDRNGDQRWTTEIEVGPKLLILGKGKTHREEDFRGEGSQRSGESSEQRPEDAERTGAGGSSATEDGTPESYDDDLPF